jgi:hypothetical protein
MPLNRPGEMYTSRMTPKGHSWRSLAEMVTSFPTKIRMVELTAIDNHLTSPAPISVQRILVLSFAVTPTAAVRAASLLCDHSSPSMLPSSGLARGQKLKPYRSHVKTWQWRVRDT